MSRVSSHVYKISLNESKNKVGFTSFTVRIQMASELAFPFRYIPMLLGGGGGGERERERQTDRQTDRHSCWRLVLLNILAPC